MNKLQQEIKDFHEQIRPALEKVLKKYNEKNTPKIYNNVIFFIVIFHSFHLN